MKHTVLIVGLLLSMAVNSEWRKVKDGLYEVMDKSDAKIINISSAGQNNWRLITTVQTNSNLYRCSHFVGRGMRLYACYILESNKQQE
jgi:hypothetical protein